MYGKVYLSIDFYKRNIFFAMSFLSFNFYILNPMELCKDKYHFIVVLVIRVLW